MIGRKNCKYVVPDPISSWDHNLIFSDWRSLLIVINIEGEGFSMINHINQIDTDTVIYNVTYWAVPLTHKKKAQKPKCLSRKDKNRQRLRLGPGGPELRQGKGSTGTGGGDVASFPLATTFFIFSSTHPLIILICLRHKIHPKTCTKSHTNNQVTSSTDFDR